MALPAAAGAALPSDEERSPAGAAERRVFGVEVQRDVAPGIAKDVHELRRVGVVDSPFDDLANMRSFCMLPLLLALIHLSNRTLEGENREVPGGGQHRRSRSGLGDWGKG